MIRTPIRAALLGVALLGLSAPAVQAQSASGILVVDINRVFAESSAGQDANRQLKAQGDSLQARVNQLQTQFKTEEDTLRKQKDSIAPEAFQQKVNEFVGRRGKAEEEVNQKQQSIQRAAAGVRQTIETNLSPIFQQLLTERSAQIVIAKEIVLANAAPLDVTSVVIQRLNTKLPKVNVQVTAAPAAPATK